MASLCSYSLRNVCSSMATSGICSSEGCFFPTVFELESEGVFKENIIKFFHQLFLGAITWRAFQILFWIFLVE